LTLSERVKQAKRVYIIGNGGSYANAIHIANDLVASGIKAFTVDPATLTAAANDYGWQQGFVRWIKTVGERGDMLIALSGSGKSPNILMACEAAEEMGMDVHREFGAAQGFDMQSSEERQVWLGHELMRALRA
jgi:D-sedoheptulose 7-phosphate isomerase